MPLIILGILFILSFLIVQPFLKALFLGGFVAYLLFPLHQKLEKKISPTWSSLILSLVVLLLIILPGFFFIKSLIQETYVIFILVKQKLDMGLFSNCQHSICESMKTAIQNPEFNFQIQEGVRSVTNWVVSASSGVLASLPRMIINLIVFLFTLFYFLKEGENLLKKIRKYLRLQKKRYANTLERLGGIIHGITFGYFVVALVQGALGALGFFIFGISSPLFWGVIMTLLALIPYLGTGFVWVPASAILILEGIFNNSNSSIVKGILLFVYCLIFVATLDNFIRPKLMGNIAKIHPLIMLVGIFGGLYFFGVLGVIIGPLILAFTSIVIENYLVKK